MKLCMLNGISWSRQDPWPFNAIPQILLLTLLQPTVASHVPTSITVNFGIYFTLTSNLRHVYLDIFFHISSLDSNASRILVCMPSLPSDYKKEIALLISTKLGRF